MSMLRSVAVLKNRSIRVLGFSVVLGIALAVPSVGNAKCNAYIRSFCQSDAFCVRVDTSADSGSVDNPESELLESNVTVSLTQSAADSTTATASATTTATAATGRLHIESVTDVGGDSGPSGSSASASPLALIRLDDLVFSGPGATVETSLNLEIGGTLSASVNQGNTHTQVTGQAQVQVKGNVCDEFGGAIFSFAGTRTVTERHYGENSLVRDEIPSSGILATIPLSGTAVVTAGPFTVPTGVPLQLELWMAQSTLGIVSMGPGPGPNPSGSGVGKALYGNTLSLPVGGPVFDLPSGYTANSQQGGITDNNDVPEPAPAIPGLGTLGVLTLVGVLAIAGKRANR